MSNNTNRPITPIMIGIETVAQITELSKSTIEALIRADDFPKPRKASPRGARWLMREIQEWAESRPVSDILPPSNTGKNAAA